MLSIVSQIRATTVTLALLAIHGCSKNTYPDAVMMCRGSIVAWSERGPQDFGNNKSITLKVNRDTVSTSDNRLFAMTSIQVCQPGENEFSNADHFFFDSFGRSLGAKPFKRTFGSFDYPSQTLRIATKYDLADLIEGVFQCQLSNN